MSSNQICAIICNHIGQQGFTLTNNPIFLLLGIKKNICYIYSRTDALAHTHTHKDMRNLYQCYLLYLFLVISDVYERVSVLKINWILNIISFK